MSNTPIRLLVEFKPKAPKRVPDGSQHKAIEVQHSDAPYQQWMNLRASLDFHLNSLTDASMSITKVHILWNVLHSYVVEQDFQWSSIYVKTDEILETQASVFGTPEPELERNEERCRDIVIALGLMKERDCWDRLCVEYSVKAEEGRR
ncbi:hypothetical protein ACHAO1_003898 [Botrytis cinerea]